MKKFLIVLISYLIILNTFTCNVYASSMNYDQVNKWWKNKVQQVIDQGYSYQNWLKDVTSMAFDNVGFLIDETGITIQKIKDAIHGVDVNQPSDMSDQDAYDWMKDNISVSDNNVVLGDQFNNFVNYYHDDYVNSYNSYIYTYDIKKYPSLCSNTQIYLALAKLLNMDTMTGQNNIFCARIAGSLCWVAKIPYREFPYAYVKKFTIGSGNDTTRIIGGKVFNGLDNTVITGNPVTNQNLKFQFLKYSSTANDGEGGFIDLDSNFGSANYLGLIDPNKYAAPSGSDRYMFVSYGRTQAIKFFDDTPSVSDILYQPYYYNNDVWYDFSTSSGDYTFSPSNINTITYGDTTSYIDSFNQTEGYPPSIPQINNYITQENEQNVNSGGGSGGDDSGGSGGGSGGDMSIFDFLSRLGEVLGGLIKNLGNMLTSLIEGIVTVITDLLTSIPDTMNTLIGAVFGWLPTELKALFALGISLMVLVGLIRLFKG